MIRISEKRIEKFLIEHPGLYAYRKAEFISSVFGRTVYPNVMADSISAVELNELCHDGDFIIVRMVSFDEAMKKLADGHCVVSRRLNAVGLHPLRFIVDDVEELKKLSFTAYDIINSQWFIELKESDI